MVTTGVVLVPVPLVFFSLQRQLIRGIALTILKGLHADRAAFSFSPFPSIVGSSGLLWVPLGRFAGGKGKTRRCEPT
jgi:hypothetical protein